MRDLVLAAVQSISVTGFTASTELPYDKDGNPLYQNNTKILYVDLPQTTQDPLIDTLNGTGISQETTTVSVFVSTDAKQLPTGYTSLVNAIKAIRLDASIQGFTQRSTAVSTSYAADRLITEFEFNFTQLINNSQ